MKYPILPIGRVNLTTGHNEMFDVIWDCWEEDTSSTNIVVKSGVGYGNSYRVIHTSGSGYNLIGKVIELQHDQTRARIGFLWDVVAAFPHTKDGLLQIKKTIGKNSVSFSTFK